MGEAGSKLYPGCTDALSPCRGAVSGCEKGELRACLAVVGHPPFVSGQEFSAALKQLRGLCASGERLACVAD
jgi:hypothetical protein